MRFLIVPVALAVAMLVAGSAAASQSIRSGQTVSGTVGSSASHQWGDGSTFDCYRLHGQAGDRVELSVRSTDFSASLAAVGGDCRVMDGLAEVKTMATSQEITLAARGEFIRVYSPAGAVGEYALTAEKHGDSGAPLFFLKTSDRTDLPFLRTDAEGELIVDTPGDDPSRVYRLELDGRGLEGGGIGDYLAQVLGAERFQIISYNPASGQAEIQTTEWGGFALTRRLVRGVDGGLTSLFPEVERIPEERCVSLLAILPAEGAPAPSGEVFGPKLCPPATRVTPGENLLVVGLDAEDRSLWTAIGDNSRFYRLEDLASGDDPLVQTGEHPDGPYVSTLVAPTLEGLARLRWFAVGADGSLEQIGEGDWRTEPGVGH